VNKRSEGIRSSLYSQITLEIFAESIQPYLS
jgi:hypothetical protein